MPLTGLVVIGIVIAFVGLGLVAWRALLTPGSCLYLRPQVEQVQFDLSITHVRQRPQMTIRRGMLVVALIALVLATAVWVRRATPGSE